MRIGILSDAHGNLPAFKAACRLLEDRGANRFLYLGDAVGYIPDLGVLEILRGMKNTTCLFGNHEDMLLNGRASAGAEDLTQHDAVRKMLTPELTAFLRGWHQTGLLRLDLAGGVLCCHGAPDAPLSGRIYPDTEPGALTASIQRSGYGDVAFVFCGHTHRPFRIHLGTQTIVNVGSCGLPRDDGQYGSACLFDASSGQIDLIRFPIREESRAFLADFSVHPNVWNLFDRKPEPAGASIHA